MSSKAVIPFLVGMMLLTGVCNTLLTKYQDMQCVAHCDRPPAEQHTFEQPVLQTLQMFIGESGCWLVVLASTLFTRYRNPNAARDTAYAPLISDASDHPRRSTDSEEEDGEEHLDPSSHGTIDPTNIPAKPLTGTIHPPSRQPLTGPRIFLLALPACCDIIATTFMNVGLLFVAASIYQMTRGALVLFVGLFSVIFLHRRLGPWKWTSLFIVVAGVALVGLAGYLERRDAATHSSVTLSRRSKEGTISVLAKEHTALETLFGVLLIAGAQTLTAAQFVLEESIMERYTMAPVRVVGWEGVFGFSVTLVGMLVLHLTVGRTDAGRGGYFDAQEGFGQMFADPRIGWTSLAIMVSIGGFNFFGLSVTRSISATARSTIDTCRTLFIWLVSLGLGWESFKWLQVPGFALLVYGTALFNEIVRPPTVRWMRRRLVE